MGPPAEPQPALGAAIRQLREQRGLSQEDLAHAAGVKRIAGALDVSMGKLAVLADKKER